VRSKIQVEGVWKRYGSEGAAEVLALKNVDLAIAEGEFLALLGPSGCGKTTLLKILAGLESASGGRVAIDGVTVTEPSERVGFVFQSAVLLPWRTILSNVLLPAEVSGRVDAASEAKARALLSMTGLADFADHYPRQLSGGMRQRAAICRALLRDPDILFMDEPFGALDAMTRDSMNEELYELWRRSGKTIVFVTHDMAEAVRLSGRIAVMSARPGKIDKLVETGFDRDATYASRIGSMNFLGKLQELRAVFYENQRVTA
jgi:NitT/TauT family transport system ATP-binding protein